MSVEITKSNYEEFYLDFLEGNLSGEVLLAFEAFLAENPELAVSEEDLVMLEPDLSGDEGAYGSFDKLLLKKQVDISGLNENTIDYFLISSTEGLLSAKDQQVLNTWLDQHPKYKRDAAIVAATKSEADLTVVFEDKESLKHKTRIIPMWWSGVAAAAAAVLLIIVFNWNPGNIEGQGSEVANSGSETDSTTVKQNAGSKDPQEIVPENENVQPVNHKNSSGLKNRIKSTQPSVLGKKEAAKLPSIDGLEIRRAEMNMKSAELATNSTPVETPKNVQVAGTDSQTTYASVDQMANPIRPVTKAISEKLDTPVDFRTAKANKKKGGGFYLKLGKLEVSHTTASMH